MLSQLSVVQAVISLSVMTLAVVWGWVHWRYRRQIAIALKLPTSLPAFPLLGHLPYITPIFKLSDQPMAILFSGRFTKKVSIIWAGPIPWFVINNAEDIRVILNSSQTLRKSEEYKLAEVYLGKGLITAPVSLWKKSRMKINRIFAQNNLKDFTISMNDSAQNFIQDLAEHDGGGSFDVEEYSLSFTLINVLNVLYGPEFTMDRDAEEFRTILKGAKTIAPALSHRALNPLLQPEAMFRLFKGKDWKIIHNMQKQVKELHHRRQQITENSKFENKEGRTIIDVDLALKEDPEFGEDYIDMELVTLIMAGTDTNAITISSCLLALGRHSEIQQHLYAEIVSVVGEDSGPVTLEDINKMHYLDQVIKETLRRFMIVPLIGRGCDKDIKLKECIIPQGSSLVLPLAALHHDPEVFPDPFRFDPDRFNPENVTKRNNYSFLPFSGGPRGCIGKTFALIVMKIALVHILRIYEIRSDVEIDDLEFSFGLAINSTTGYHISVKRRIIK